jgi:hypothetical protein
MAAASLLCTPETLKDAENGAKLKLQTRVLPGVF